MQGFANFSFGHMGLGGGGGGRGCDRAIKEEARMDGYYRHHYHPYLHNHYYGGARAMESPMNNSGYQPWSAWGEDTLSGCPSEFIPADRDSDSVCSHGSTGSGSTGIVKVPTRNRKRGRSDGSGKGKGKQKTEPHQPAPLAEELTRAQREHANQREKARNDNLNQAFSKLRRTIPTLPSDKLSKIQTLKLASRYIEFLYNVLGSSADQTAMGAQSFPSSNSGGRMGFSSSAPASDQELFYAFSVWRMENECRREPRAGDNA